MKTKTNTLTSEQISLLKQTYHNYIVKKEIPYVQFQLKLSDCTITVYDSNKVVYQGDGADFYSQSNSGITHAGSDEVGTGDYFGPVVVVAAIVESSQYDLLSSFQVQDSKGVTDEKILEIAPKLMKLCPYSLLICDNEKYNEIHKTANMNAIKAKLHNQAYVNLNKKVGLPNLQVVDQFTPRDSYFRYLNGEKEIVDSVHLETKAENKYLAVAVASMIARYAFLKSLEKMEEKYNFTFTKGASDKVDQDAAAFIQQFGEEELYKVAKVHFKNTEKALSYLRR